MSVKEIVLTYVLMAVVFLALDLFWLGLIAKNFYQKHLGRFFSDKVNWTAAIIFYFLFVLGTMIFAVYPGVAQDSLMRAMIFGVLFGLFTYATYDLTNLATLKDWPVPIVIVDIIWGMVLCGTISVFGFGVAKWLV
ncbi:MAG: hypothetical protein AMJ70_00050 [Dehalococcoidia bacterium SG8_51_3]|jgi:uncharacterized membrane protein|nr:MAG: hypothetical protein AMJ70_00050 [Dehalococcoidia bacterium SG8_51_3]